MWDAEVTHADSVAARLNGGNAEENGNSSGTSRAPTRANIRTWIHERAVSRLRQILWEGHGSRLLQETTANPTVRKFLDAVPQVLAAIKEVHALAVANRVDLLKKRTAPPAPRELLLSKDSNGLTPLHKAAGLGNSESVRVILEKALDSVRAKDDQGKLPLHYAAYAVGSSGVREENKEVTYHLLVEAGSDESQTDNRGKTASHYLQHPGEVDSSRLLVVPEAPRTAHSAVNEGIPESALWISWRLLVSAAPEKRPAEDDSEKGTERDVQPREKEPSVPADKDSFSPDNRAVGDFNERRSFLQQPVAKKEEEERELEGVRSGGLTTEGAKSLLPPQISPPPSPPPRPASPQEIPLTQSAPPPPKSPPKVISTPHTEPASPPEITEDHTNTLHPPVENEDKETLRNPMPQSSDIAESRDELTNTSDPNDASSPAERKEETKEMTSKRPTEMKKVAAEKELNVAGNATSEANAEYEVRDDELKRAAGDGDIELLVSIVLRGEGSRLIGLTSDDPKTQSFLYDVPMQMEMIREIHEAASKGLVKDIQARLERRKYAVAKEPSIGAIPLHAAVLGASKAHQRTKLDGEGIIKPFQTAYLELLTTSGAEAMIRYLGGRFPETINQRDRYDRTPLHYATALPSEEVRLRLYEMLRQLGADSTTEDSLGHTPAYYLSSPKDFPHEDLLPYMEYIKWEKSKETETESSEEEEGVNVPAVATPPSSSIGSAEGTLSRSSSNSQDPMQPMDMPALWTEEGQYLAKSLGEPLVKGLTEVSQRRPKDPVGFLADYLKTFPRAYDATAETLTEGLKRMNREAHRENLGEPFGIGPFTEVFRSREERDEHGQTAIHKAAGRSGSRGSLLHLLRETGSNVALRDEFYRTPRDVAARAGLQQNVREIDTWIVTLARAGPLQDDQNGKEILEAEAATNMLKSILLEGYDHILDATSLNSSRESQGSSRSKKRNLLDAAKESSYLPIISFLKSIPMFEERREWLHSAIRAGSLEHTQEILLAASDSFDGSNSLGNTPSPSLPSSPSLPNSPGEDKLEQHMTENQDWSTIDFNSSEKFSPILGPVALAIAKNRHGRCSMHVAVLCQHLEIAKFIAQHFPQTLHVGDNLERTPLHYAMGIETVDSFSLVLIQAGAKRIIKDLRGKQPSYYFINKSDIQKLQDEETFRE